MSTTHFNKSTLKKLSKKGITIIGATWLPGPDGSYTSADACTGYQLNNNGQGQVRTFLQVLDLAK